MKEPITQQDTTLNKEEFVKGVIYTDATGRQFSRGQYHV
jgi:hypothetical protein